MLEIVLGFMPGKIRAKRELFVIDDKLVVARVVWAYDFNFIIEI